MARVGQRIHTVHPAHWIRALTSLADKHFSLYTALTSAALYTPYAPAVPLSQAC